MVYIHAASLQWQLSQQLGDYDTEDLGVSGMSGQASPEQDLLEPSSRVIEIDPGEDVLDSGVDLSIASRILSPSTSTHGAATTLAHPVDPSSLDIGWTDWTTTAGFGRDLGLGLDIATRDVDIMESDKTTA